jgi:purine-binding chemotaxis protein CheW
MMVLEDGTRATGGENREIHLLCRLGSRVCALPLARVSETMRPLPIEPLAGTPPFVLGLSIIRGVPTPVVDIARLVGVADLHPTRLVTVKTGRRPAALAVGAILGVRALSEGQLSAIPPLVREAGADLIAAIGALDAELLLLLETACLIPDSAWRAIEAAGAPP